MVTENIFGKGVLQTQWEPVQSVQPVQSVYPLNANPFKSKVPLMLKMLPQPFVSNDTLRRYIGFLWNHI